MTNAFDGRAMIENCKRLRAERLREIDAACKLGRARWGNLVVLSYDGDRAMALVRDDGPKGDGMVRRYMVGIGEIKTD